MRRRRQNGAAQEDEMSASSAPADSMHVFVDLASSRTVDRFTVNKIMRLRPAVFTALCGYVYPNSSIRSVAL